MIRFTLSDVEHGARYRPVPADTVMRALLNRPVEALDCMAAELLEEDNCNAFAKAACRASMGTTRWSSARTTSGSASPRVSPTTWRCTASSSGPIW